ncbi:MAG: ATP-dependent DNA helicase [Chlamydiae bacterium]|nr:ATP-dependent DNA helicase [Chlamydiota bacterium]
MQTETDSLPLNEVQTEAAKHIEGPLLVLAGAGSGKTRIVTARILHLLQIGVPASEILAVTFTNKAAEEMKKRIFHLSQAHILTCTFHSLCARILRESISYLGYTNDFLILDEEDSDKWMKQCLTLLELPTEKAFVKNVKNQISQAKGEFLSPEDLPMDQQDVRKVYAMYQEHLRQSNSLDFDDLLFLSVKLLQNHKEVLDFYQKRWRFILIDEYQDTNHAQYLLIKLLSSLHHNVFAVGDPDQSIYSWRGANICNILNFEQDYIGAKIVLLEQNYRSCNIILKASNALIQNNTGRFEKNLWSHRSDGDRIGLFIADNERKEADFVAQKLLQMHQQRNIPLTDCAIFYRTNFQSRTFEDALLRENIPYKIIGGLSFYQRREIKDLLAFLRMLLTDCDSLSFFRTVNIPKRGFGQTAQEKFQKGLQEHKLSIFALCLRVLKGEIDLALSSKQLQGLSEYIELIKRLRVLVKEGKPLHEVLLSTVEQSRYFTYLQEDKESYMERRANVEELLAKATEWEKETTDPSLATFLEELTLKSSLEDKDLRDAVRLMTLHNSKGLEFSLAFLVGMEEELFPHINAKDFPSLLEEERRLCYVGMTRAKDYLFLTASRYRFLWGFSRVMHPSRFLKEIPSHFLQPLQHSSFSQGEEELIHYDEDVPLPKGASVMHRDFGSGTIQKSYRTSLGITYDVFFPGLSITKTLAAKYAKLKQIT